MKIRYLGHSCFQLFMDNRTIIITDPYKEVGYELPEKLSADIVTVSHDHFDHNNVSAVSGMPEWIQGEGTGESCGVNFIGIKTWHDPLQGTLRGKNTVYVMEFDDVRICHLGDIGEVYTSELGNKIGNVDILLIPVGGTYTIDAEQAKEYVDGLLPKIVIPMHYRPFDGKLDIDGADKFLLQYAEEKIEQKKGEIQLSKAEIKNAQQKIIFMERMN